MTEAFKIALAPYMIEGGDFEPGMLTMMAGWPTIQTDDGEEIMDDTLDTENFGFVGYTNTTLTISCGGDWQNPHTVVIAFSNGELIIESCEEGTFDDNHELYQEIKALFTGINPDDIPEVPQTRQELNYEMQQCIAREDYKRCAEIRDEIKERFGEG